MNMFKVEIPKAIIFGANLKLEMWNANWLENTDLEK